MPILTPYPSKYTNDGVSSVSAFGIVIIVVWGVYFLLRELLEPLWKGRYTIGLESREGGHRMDAYVPVNCYSSVGSTISDTPGSIKLEQGPG